MCMKQCKRPPQILCHRMTNTAQCWTDEGRRRMRSHDGLGCWPARAIAMAAMTQRMANHVQSPQRCNETQWLLLCTYGRLPCPANSMCITILLDDRVLSQIEY